MEGYPATNTQLFSALEEIAQFIKSHLGEAKVSMVLGSGLGNFWQRLENRKLLPYSQIPYMSVPDVPGHSGTLYYGEVSGLAIYCWGGRPHLYEGFETYKTALIAHISAHLGCHTMLLTNGSGGGMRGMKAGCALVIRDHISNEGFNTLDSYYHALYNEPNFAPQEIYSEELSAIAKEVGEREKFLPIYEGTYFCCSGPTFETPYETRSYIALGGNTFGMSTIPEALAARSHGMKVLGMSLITNLASCLVEGEILHEDILKTSNLAANAIEMLFCKILEKIAVLPPGPSFDTSQIRLRSEASHSLLRRKRFVHLMPFQMWQAVSWLHELNRGCAPLQLAFCCNSCSCQPQLTDRREVLLTDLPFFPAFSHAGKRGKLVLGSTDGTRVALVFCPTVEGLDPFEGVYLAQIFREVGVRHLHYRFQAEDLSAGQAEAPVYLQDYFAFTSQCLANDLFTSRKPVRITALGDRNVVAWAGPGYPSSAEKELSRRLGGHFVTIADMSILNAAGQVGLTHSASVLPKGSECCLQEMIAKVKDLPYAEKVAEVIVPLFLGPPLPVLVTDIQPFEVEAAARSLAQPGSVKLTVISSSNVFSRLSAVLKWSIAKTLSFQDCPRCLHLTTSNVLILEGLPDFMQGEDHLRHSIPMRISNILGTNPLLVLTDAVGAAEDVQVGSIVAVKDHCSLAGVNPLTGHNIPAWGTRFPDMSETYPEALIEKATAILAQHGLPLQSVFAAHIGTARLRLGPAGAAAAAAIGSKVILRHGVQDAILSQHRREGDPRRQVLLLGHVGSHALKPEEAERLQQTQVRAVADVISALSS